jgi:hypothetical protein
MYKRKEPDFVSGRVLYATNDKARFTVRAGALLRSGYPVSSPRHPIDSIAMVRIRDYVAVLVGNSILRADRIQIIRGIKKIKPHQPIVYFSDFAGDVEPEADVSVYVSSDFGKLMQTLEQIEREGELELRREKLAKGGSVP